MREHKISSPIGLQIGNYVLNRHGELSVVTGYTFSEFLYPKMSGYYGIEAIPLTREFLLRLGFSHSNNNNYYKSENGFGLFWNDTPDDVAMFEKGVYWGDHYLHIKYVHQLQNLYFSITGDQLQIKE